ncbi:MAG: hypothetical protein CVV42_08400 [Candidatus Riflebacteria bacterium HGW-Riflebacteria-2]|jgi:hypothetical protein|nr:MAG: hypothetical protein CVV42_08400 [Candidatus Riflebacteria bacterium HGW-Riflebacteria-2]
MKQANSYFLAGAILTAIIIAVAGGNLITSVFASSNLGRQPRELRLGCELGIIMPDQLKTRMLDRRIPSADFSEKLALVMMLLGANESENARELVKNGIIEGNVGSRSMSRANTLETLARASIFLAGKGLISLDNEGASNYRDYRIADKYSKAVAWLQAKYVVRGYPDGSLGKKRNLTLREAVFFLHRFYEAASSEMMSKRPAEKLSFIDVTLSHPIMQPIENLTRAGAFDKIILRPSFDGESFVSRTDLTEMLKGIFARAGKDIDEIRLKAIFADSGTDSSSHRRHLALALEYILDSFAKNRLSAQKIDYSDVDMEQPEFESLIKLAGCGLKLGYGDGRFAGNESVTWYETVRLLDEVLKFAEITAKESAKKDRLAVKSDLESLKALLRAKKDKIHQILTNKKN